MNAGRLGLGNIANAFVDPNDQMAHEFVAGMKEGAQNVLTLMQGKKALHPYTRNMMEISRTEHRLEADGVNFRIPTAVEGVYVDYLYPGISHYPDLSIVVDKV